MSDTHSPEPGEPAQPQPPSGGTARNPTSAASLVTLMSACFFTALVAIGASQWLARDAAAAHRPIVFLDTTKLVGLKALELSSKQMTPEEVDKAGRAFAERLKGEIKELQSSGAIVIHGGALLAESDENDLTNEMAGRLGLNLQAKLEVPLAKPVADTK